MRKNHDYDEIQAHGEAVCDSNPLYDVRIIYIFDTNDLFLFYWLCLPYRNK
jgi:hypothetical protein